MGVFRKRAKKIGRSGKMVLLMTVLTWFLLSFVFLLGYVPTESMEPTLEKGSLIIGIRIYPELQVGDVIIFRHESQLLVKRIAAAKGDVVEWDGGYITVPEGCYYVLGDNGENSYDSRYWEEPFVKEETIVAKLPFLFCTVYMLADTL